MTTVIDAELFSDADRVRGKVVLITGAANGLGRETALLFGKHGANVVIGDVDIKGAEAVASEIEAFGSRAIAQKCDVTSWDQQQSLFLVAVNNFKRIDIVVPNAGITELGRMSAVQEEDGMPTKPNMRTFEINMVAVIYTARLALYYLLKNNSGDMKSIVFMGSMSSIQGIPGAPLYSTSKHGVVGLMGSLYGEYRDKIRFAVICPWFADTSIVPKPVKLLLAGLPLTPASRIGGAIFKAATDANPETNGALWMLPDDGPLLRLDRSKLNLHEGVYRVVNDRAAAGFRLRSRLQNYLAIFQDIYRIVGGKAFFGLIIIIGGLRWSRHS